MPPLQLEKPETVHSGHIYIVSFRILQILTVRSIPRRALLCIIKTFCSVIPICFNATQPWPLQWKKRGKVKRFSVLVYISLPLKLLFLLSSVWMLPMFSFLSKHIPFIFVDKHENILRSLPGEKLRFCVTATRVYPASAPLPTPPLPLPASPTSEMFLVGFWKCLDKSWGWLTSHLAPKLTQAKQSSVRGGTTCLDFWGGSRPAILPTPFHVLVFRLIAWWNQCAHEPKAEHLTHKTHTTGRAWKSWVSRISLLLFVFTTDVCRGGPLGLLWHSQNSFCLLCTSLTGCSPPSLKWCWTGASEMGISPPGLTRVFLPNHE